MLLFNNVSVKVSPFRINLNISRVGIIKIITTAPLPKPEKEGKKHQLTKYNKIEITALF